MIFAMGMQDYVAIGLAVLGIGFAWWLHRRVAGVGGCAHCPMAQEHLKKDGG